MLTTFVLCGILVTTATPAAEPPADTSKTGKAEADPIIGESTETVEIPAGRPAWVGAEPRLSGKIHTVAVASGPYKKPRDAQRALDDAIEKATSDYIVDQLGSEAAPRLLHYDTRTIKQQCIKDANQYHDQARYPEPVGLMHENFALLEFGPEFRDQLYDRWMAVRATSRVKQTGVASIAVVLLVASVFGYFRLDSATRGYYSGRLQFMTAAAALAVAGATMIAAKWITWL